MPFTMAHFLLMVLFLTVNAKKHPRTGCQPHVVVLLADDLGWNEVSWHNKMVLTPHMQELLDTGVGLENSYVTPKCSPSRAALLTGRYPWRTGMQRGAIRRFEPNGLNSSLKLLPEYLQEAGYRTHLVGKWHLGYCHPSYLPTRRGFLSAFGQWTHATNYYTRKTTVFQKKSGSHHNPKMLGYDFHDGEKPTYEGQGIFLTDLLTKKAVEVISSHPKESPLFLYVSFQAPHAPIVEPPQKYLYQYERAGLFQGDSDHDRTSRQRLGTISALDAGAGAVVRALKEAGLYDDSVVVFSTDNGGYGRNSNYPLKGEKEFFYEGGVRGVGFVHSPLIKNPGRTSNRLMYVTDWFSTFLGLAGVPLPKGLDSLDMWPSISRNRKSPRKEIVLNVDKDDSLDLWSAVIIKGKFKLVWGKPELLKILSNTTVAKSSNTMELYNLKSDPSEKTNLAIKRRKTVAELKTHLLNHFENMVPARYPKTNRAGWPGGFKGRKRGHFSTGWCSAQ